MTTTNQPLALTIKEAAVEARVSTRTIGSWIASARLPSRKIGGCRRILREDLHRIMTPIDDADIEVGEPGTLMDRRYLDAIIGTVETDRLIASQAVPSCNGRLLRGAVKRMIEHGEARK